MLGFLAAPWPRYVTTGDVMLNIVAYFPLVAMLFASLRPALSPTAAFAAATLLATLLSVALESAQLFLPARIASNLDVITNSLGAALGALAAGLLSLPAMAPLAAFRRNALRPGPLGDCGVVIIGLWLVIQFQPGSLALGSGDWRDMLQIAPYFPHTPQAYLLAEAGVVALAVVAIGLLASLLLRPQRSTLHAIMMTLALTVVVKCTASALMTRAAHWMKWLTPGALFGIACGAALLALLVQLRPPLRAGVAGTCIITGVLLVNVTPENPYYAMPVFMLSPQPTHLVNFSHIVRSLSLMWPLAAIVYLALVAKADYAAVR